MCPTLGENDNVAGFDIKLHPLGSIDANLHIFTKEVQSDPITVRQYTPDGWEGGNPSETIVENVSFMALVRLSHFYAIVGLSVMG